VAKPAGKLSPTQARQRKALLAKLATGEFAYEEVPTCPCGVTGGVVVADHDRFGIPIGVLACPSCGLLRTSPRLAADDLPAFYESDYHGLHFGLIEPTASTSLFRAGQGARIWAYLSAARGHGLGDRLSVVEIGAGSGTVLRELMAAARADGVACNGVGCEYSSVFAAAGRALGTEIHAGGIETLLEIGLHPDVVIMSHVLEHFADPTRDLELVKTLVGPTTLVYVEVPGLLTIHHKPQYDYQFSRYLTLAHTFHFTLATLVDVMARAGFSLVSGDEEVRALFMTDETAPLLRGGDGAEITNLPGARLARLTSYLRWLEASPRMRVRRAALRAQRGANALARHVARRVLGERAVRGLRRMLRR
jgi:SAM-dependent methyltransferase